MLILDESSTMDDDLGGGEGVASSDDVNDISSAAQESLSTGIRLVPTHNRKIIYDWSWILPDQTNISDANKIKC